MSPERLDEKGLAVGAGSSGGSVAKFPEISVAGPGLNAKELAEKGTGAAVAMGTLVAIVALIAAAVSTFGVALILLVAHPFIGWYLNRKAMAQIRGSGVRLGEAQMPEIHRCVQVFAQRLGLKDSPEVYIVEAAMLNAVAIRYGKKNVILLTDDLIHGSLMAESPKALAFVIGHEMGHIALKHTGLFRSIMAQYNKKLGRLDEYSADRVGRVLVGDREGALEGMVLLTVGPQVMPYINWQALGQQVREVEADKYTVKAERTLSHPLLLNRIARMIRG